MDDKTSKISQEQVDGTIVNSVTGPSVNSEDPKNIIIPEIPSVEVVHNKANKDGTNTTGGVWQIDYIVSDALPDNKSVVRATQGGYIIYGSHNLKGHVFEVSAMDGLKIKVGEEEGYILSSLMFDIEQFNDEIPNWSNELNTNTNFNI